MNICGVDYQVLDVYDQSITVPDSYVMNENKTGKGHGEAKPIQQSKTCSIVNPGKLQGRLAHHIDLCQG